MTDVIVCEYGIPSPVEGNTARQDGVFVLLKMDFLLFAGGEIGVKERITRGCFVGFQKPFSFGAGGLNHFESDEAQPRHTQ